MSPVYLDEDSSRVDANSLSRAELEARIRKFGDDFYCIDFRNPDNPAESVRCQNCLTRFQIEDGLTHVGHFRFLHPESS